MTTRITMTRRQFQAHAGYISARRTAKDGGWNVLYRAEEQGIPAEDGGKYAIVCDQHGTLLQCTNLTMARSALRFPDFCECCDGRCLPAWADYPCPNCGRTNPTERDSR